MGNLAAVLLILFYVVGGLFILYQLIKDEK